MRVEGLDQEMTLLPGPLAEVADELSASSAANLVETARPPDLDPGNCPICLERNVGPYLVGCCPLEQREVLRTFLSKLVAGNEDSPSDLPPAAHFLHPDCAAIAGLTRNSCPICRQNWVIHGPLHGCSEGVVELHVEEMHGAVNDDDDPPPLVEGSDDEDWRITDDEPARQENQWMPAVAEHVDISTGLAGWVPPLSDSSGESEVNIGGRSRTPIRNILVRDSLTRQGASSPSPTRRASPWQLSDFPDNRALRNDRPQVVPRQSPWQLQQADGVQQGLMNIQRQIQPAPTPVADAYLSPRRSQRGLGRALLEFQQHRRPDSPTATSPFRPQPAPFALRAETRIVQPASSSTGSRAQTDAQLQYSTDQWVNVIRSFGQASELFRIFEATDPRWETLVKDLVSGSASNTLDKHIGPWKKWSAYCVDKGDPCNPTPTLVMNYIDTQRYKKGLRAFRSSLNFVCFKLQVTSLQAPLRLLQPVIESKLKANQQRRREATPWSLEFYVKVFRMIEATSDTPKLCRLGAVAISGKCGLRFSDIQRSDVAEFALDRASIRGYCYRSKTRRTGFPFGGIRTCITGADWGAKVFNAFKLHMPAADYLFESTEGGVGKYRDFRNFISEISGRPHPWTGHSGKATLCCWAGQLSLDEIERLCQGHHKPGVARGMTVLYSRDDVGPQLRLQARITLMLKTGWRPVQPLLRGGRLGEEPPVDFDRMLPLPYWLHEMLPEHWQAQMQERAGQLRDAAREEILAIKEDSASEEGLTEGSSSSSDEDDRPTPESSRSSQERFQGDRQPPLPQSSQEQIFLVSLAKNIVHIGIKRGDQADFHPACGKIRSDDFEEHHTLAEIRTSRCRHVACRTRMGED